MDSLAVALPVFLASALVVVFAGGKLARYGDEVAESTGWGTLWVGTILVSIATSLPELVTNITSVSIGAPALALGNVLGADMINMFTLSVVALFAGAYRVFSGQSRDTVILATVAVVLGAVVLIFGTTGDTALATSSVGGLVIAAIYIFGMRAVYNASRRDQLDGDEAAAAPRGSAKGAWIGFGIASVVIVAASAALASSADGIANATGLSAGFVGVLAVSVVTTLPEASVSFAAARRGSYGIVLGNLYGSCAFNIFILPIADLFNGGAILNSMSREHFIAGGTATVLMTMGLAVLLAHRVPALARARVLLPAIAVIYPISLYWVYRA